jgi:hypothetical protein
MLIKIITFIIGFVLSSLSLTFLLLYLNILNLGYSFIEFVNFIIRKWELYLFFVGIILMVLSLRKDKNNDIYL